MTDSRPSRFDPVAAQIEDALRRYDLPSAAIAVAQDGEIVWEEGFGWADREARLPATPHTLYSLASISKPITATALMVLVERSLVDLDRPIIDYLGESGIRSAVFDPREATVRRVAQHTAGLPHHFQFFYADEEHVRPPMEETIRRYGYLMTPPGERYGYSNLGYGILDHLIARVSGRPFDEFVRQEVFLPLGITHASVGVPDSLRPYAAPYGADDVPYPPYTTDHPGASEIWSSAHDLALFGAFHIDGGPIVSDASRAAMTAHPARINEEQRYGLGWGVTENERGYRTLVHDGGMGGVRTALWLVPSEGLVISVLTNSSKDTPAGIWTMRDWIASAILPAFAESVERPGAEPCEPVRIPDELLGEWDGVLHTYEGDVRLHLWVRGPEGIRARLGDGPIAPVDDVSMEDGYLSGRMPGTMPTADARKRAHQLILSLFRLRGETLTGAITALRPPQADGGAPDHRMGNALTHPAELHRAGTARG